MRLTLKFSDKFLQEVVDEYSAWYGVQLTKSQLKKLLQSDPTYAADALESGFDTVSREGLSSLVCKYIGLKKEWPLGKTSKSESIAFFKEFYEKAKLKGIKLDDDFLKNYGAE